MDISRPEFSYVLLIIPSILAVTVLAQGVEKVVHEKPGGKTIIVFGVTLLVLIIVSYFLFIQ